MANMAIEICCDCGIEFHVPVQFQRACQENSKKSFHCPNGHSQHYTESEADKLRRERDKLKQEQAYLNDRLRQLRDEREAAERSASARKGVITRMKKRAAAGVCQCCNRTFQNLANHMANKHPKFVAEEVV